MTQMSDKCLLCKTEKLRYLDKLRLSESAEASALNEQYLIVVHVEIVGCREDGYETWEASGLAFAVHPVPAWWNLVTRVSRRFLADIFAQCISHHRGIQIQIK